MLYNLYRDKSTGEAFVTVIIPGEEPLPAGNDHPNFEAIVSALENDAPLDEVRDLFDVSLAAEARFRTTLSDRVAVSNGRIYFDGDEVDNALTRQVVRFLDEDVTDWKPLVGFFEKVQRNPEQHSREQLYVWLDRHGFTLTPTGDIVAYKGVQPVDGGYVSRNTGFAIVNGEEVNGKVPNNIGDTVEMPRSQVEFNPSVGCSYGLHVGTREYAAGWGDVVLEVHVDPTDVVSVPTDSDAQKVRTCRYFVEDVSEAKYDTAVLTGPELVEDPTDFENVLLDAIDDDNRIVTIDYKAEDGNETFDRGIVPLQIDSARYGVKSVLAKDVEKNQPRYFRLDRIQRIAA